MNQKIFQQNLSWFQKITIDTISLVYVKEYNADGENYAVPTWRVEYIQNNESAIAGRTGTIYIDAVSGFVVNN